MEEVSIFRIAPPGEGGKTVAGKTEYKNNWQKENVDRINLIVPKGQKEAIKAHAEARGESVNGFVNRAISEAMERDNGAPAASEGPEKEKPQA